MAERKNSEGLKVGSHQFPHFDCVAAAFGGADRADYPSESVIPADFMSSRNPYCRVFSALFFNGGKLADFGLSIRAEIDRNEAMMSLRALMGSFAPKHEIKQATVAWCLSEWCDGTPKNT